MISKIEEIYREVYVNSPIAEKEDKQLDEKIEKLLEDVQGYQSLAIEDVRNVVYDGSSISQAQGFQEGFRYAMALVFESLVC